MKLNENQAVVLLTGASVFKLRFCESLHIFTASNHLQLSWCEFMIAHNGAIQTVGEMPFKCCSF